MKVFKLGRKGVLRPAWVYRTSGVVWRVLPSNNGKILGEVRYPDRKGVEFFCVNRRTGEVLWEKRSFGRGWWIGMEGAHRDVLYLHGFVTPDMPEHREVIAVDMISGEQLWYNPDVRFNVASGDAVYVTRETPEGLQVLELEYRTGAILRSWGSNHQVVREARIRNLGPEPSPVFPVPRDAVPDVDSRMNDLLQGENSVGPVEIIQDEFVIVAGFHTPSGATTDDGMRMDNVVKVMNRATGTVVFRDLINAGIAGLLPESFFVQEGILFYIKERRNLIAVRLHDSG